jgi:RHS repeat-associated protein
MTRLLRRVPASLRAALVLLGLGCADTEDKRDDLDLTDVTEALTTAQVNAARQVGLLPNFGAAGFVTPTFFDPPPTSDPTRAALQTGTTGGGINNQGVVVGWAQDIANGHWEPPGPHPMYPFYSDDSATSPASPVTHDLQIPAGVTGVYPNLINANGDIIGNGYSATAGWQPLILYSGANHNTMTVLPGLAGDYSAGDMTDDAHPILVGGVDSLRSGSYRFFRYDTAGVSPEVFAHPPTYVTGAATGINARGDIVGYYAKSDGLWRALAYVDGQWLYMTEALPADSGWERLEMTSDVNDNRQVTGWGIRTSGERRAFIYDLNNNTVTDLGTITGQQPTFHYRARRANAKGHVVGAMTSWGYPYLAFIWTPEWGMLDLNSFIDPASGWVLRDTFGINDNDEIVGWARHDQLGYKLFRMKVSLPGPEFFQPADGMKCTIPLAINASGDVSGYSDACDHGPWHGWQPMRPWVSEHGAARGLPMPNGGLNMAAWAISDGGYVVGNGWNPSTAAWSVALYRPLAHDQPEWLTLPSREGSALAIRNVGGNPLPLIAMAATTGSGPNLWQWGKYQVMPTGQSGQLTSIPQPSSGFTGEGGPYAMNRNGDLAGWYTLTSGERNAMAWTPEDGLRDLNMLIEPTSGWFLRAALGMNETRVIVGFGTHNSLHRAFRLDLTTQEIIDLGTLDSPYQALSYNANAINVHGHIVGTAGYDGSGGGYHLYGERAFIYTDDLGITDLNDIVPMPPGWILRDATGINDNDEVIGWAQREGGTQRRAYKVKLQLGTAESTTPLPIPIVDCVAAAQGAEQIAVFGYSNPTGRTARLPSGPTNAVTIAASDVALYGSTNGSAPTWFDAGGRHGAFLVHFSAGNSVTWTLGATQAIASSSSPACSLVTPQPSTGPAVSVGGVEVPLDTSPDAVLATALVAPDVSSSSAYAFGGASGTTDIGADGSLSYHLPLWVPEGRRGLKPQLALEYTSRGGGGVLGLGWSVSGLSRISRCAKTRAFDGHNEPVLFNDDDAFCLDGKRLRRISSSGGNGAEYRLEDDPGTRIVLHQTDPIGPDYFDVYSGTGRRMRYGTAPGTSGVPAIVSGDRLVQKMWVTSSFASGPQSLSTAPTRFAWAVSSILDPGANEITFSYNSVFSFVPEAPVQSFLAWELRPSEIAYAGGNRKVSFIYKVAPRDDQRITWISGFPIADVSLLDRIQVSAPAPTVPRPLRDYRFAYDPSPMSQRPLLSSVTECAVLCPTSGSCSPTCRRPITFGYEQGSEEFEQMSTGISIDGLNGKAPILSLHPADIDGDGKDEIIVRRGAPAGSCTTIFGWQLPFTDCDAGTNSSYSHIRKLASGFEESGPVIQTDKPDYWVSEEVPIDFNLDGLTDFGTFVSSNIQGWRGGSPPGFNWVLHTPLPTPPSAPISIGFGPIVDEIARVNVWARHYFSDIDGDGRPDLMHGMDDGTTCGFGVRFNSLGTGLSPFQFATGGIETGGIFVAGVTGDSRTSLLIRTNLNTHCETLGPVNDFYWALLGAPASLPPFGLIMIGGQAVGTPSAPYVVPTSLPTGGLSSQSTFSYLMADLNGDGITDAISTPKSWGFPSVRDGYGLAAPVGGNGSPPFTQLGAVMFGNERTSELDAESEFQPVIFTVPGGVGHVSDTGLRLFDYDEDDRPDLIQLGKWFETTGSRPKIAVIRSNSRGQLIAQHKEIQVSGVTAHLDVGWAIADPLEAGGLTFRLSKVLDINGDGLTDIVQVDPNDKTLRIFKRMGKKADMLKVIRDGLGAQTQISYLPLSDQSVYTRADRSSSIFCQYPQKCLTKGWVVAGISRDNGGNSFNTTNYHYSDARADVLGRGFVGFESISSYDAAHRTTKTVHYNNGPLVLGQSVYPFARLRTSEHNETALSSGSVRTVDRTYINNIVAGSATSVFAARATSMHEVVREDGTTVVDHTTTSGFNSSFGYLTEHHDTGWTTTDWSADFEPDDTANWLLGRRRRVTARSTPHAAADGPPVTRTTAYAYWNNTSLLQEVTTEPDGDASVYLKTIYDRDPATGLVTGVTERDKLNRERRTRYDYQGPDQVYVERVVNALEQEERRLYHPGLGVVAVETDPNGLKTVRQFDTFGLLRLEKTPGLPAVERHYRPDESDSLERGGAITTSVTSGPTDTTRIDCLGRVVRIDASGVTNRGTVTTSVIYDTLGHPYSIARPHLTTDEPVYIIQQHDELDRLVSTQTGTHPPATVTYSPGRATFIDENGHQQDVDRDQSGRVIRSIRSGETGHPVAVDYSYAAFDLPATITTHKDSNNNPVIRSEYDVLGRLVRLTDPDAGIKTMSYNGFGEPRTERRADGTVVRHFYDSLGRLTRTAAPEGDDVVFWDTAPGGIGRPAGSVSFDSVAEGYSFDQTGRVSSLTQFIQGDAFATVFHYDPITGKRSGVDYPDPTNGTPLSIHWNYDAFGNLASVMGPGASTLYEVRDRDQNGRIVSAKSGNGLVSTRSYFADTGLLHTLAVAWPTNVGGDGTVLKDLEYLYDDAGNFHQRIDRTVPASARTEIFDHDPLDRLSSWREDGLFEFIYNYDDIGNLTSRTADLGQGTSLTFNHGEGGAGPHMVTSSSLGSGYVYDANGNQVQAPGRSVGSLTSFDLPRSLTGSQTTNTFAYDASHTRRLKQANDGSFTKYVADSCEYRRSASGAYEMVCYVEVEGEVVAEISGATIRYIHSGQWGTPEVVTDVARAAEHIRFDPFGVRVSAANPDVALTSAPSLRIGFTANEHDDDVRLINMNGRLYDPLHARFISPDPLIGDVLNSQSLNRYSYALNNPITLADRSGMLFEGIDPSANPLGGYDSAAASSPPSRTVSIGDASMNVPCDSDCGSGPTTVTVERTGFSDDSGTAPPAAAGLPAPAGVGGLLGGSGVIRVPNVGDVPADRVFAQHPFMIFDPPAVTGETQEEYVKRKVTEAKIDAVRGGVGMAVPLVVAGGEAAVALGVRLTLRAPQLIVPGGGLAAHEGAGRGHTLSRHVGQTVAGLIARLASQARLQVASTFASRASAESILSTVLNDQAAKVSQWIASGATNRLVLDQSFGTATGFGIVQGTTQAFTTFGARLVLMPDIASRLGYYILTAHPTP